MKTSPSHTIIKLSKIKCKQKFLKEVKEKKIIIYKGPPTELSANLPATIMQTKKKWIIHSKC